MTNRSVQKIFKPRPITEGAGVKLKRVFDDAEGTDFDPFLLMDDFHSSNPNDYTSGFPMHPHRGIETITYLLHGEVHHRDSMGNTGVIQDGDIQWMTAGSGIIHEEMPQPSEPELWGFQLWLNLPATQKMRAPRYQNIKAAAVPSVSPQEGVNIRVICGEVAGKKGPVEGAVADPEYLDISLEAGTQYTHPVKRGHTVFGYILSGEAFFDETGNAHSFETLVLLGEGDAVQINTTEQSARLLLISGAPISEPIAWRGPIVMNTEAELETAFEDYRRGTFVK